MELTTAQPPPRPPMDPNRIVTTYHQERSYNGHPLDELLSALQKYARRAETTKALWVAGELYLFSFALDKRGKAIYTNFAHRLMIIFLEDVGPVGVRTWPHVAQLARTVLVREDSAERQRAVGDLVQHLCLLPHTRILSHYASFLRDPDAISLTEIEWRQFPRIRQLLAARESDFNARMPFTFQPGDQIVARAATNLIGALEARSELAVYWCYRILRAEKVGRHLGRQQPLMLILDILKSFAATYAFDFDLRATIEAAIEWARELDVKERVLIATYPIVCIVLSEHLAHSPDRVDTQPVDFVGWALNGRMELDDYVVDMHTRRGKSRGRGRAEFALEGSVVQNEHLVIEEYRQFYNYLKTREGAPMAATTPVVASATPVVAVAVPTPAVAPVAPTPAAVEGDRESGVFEFLVRAQLTCSQSRPDTYFARVRRPLQLLNYVDREGTGTAWAGPGQIVFVKGPYPAASAAQIPLRIRDMKFQAGLSTIEMAEVRLIPDLIQNVPVGCRRDVDLSRPAPFLVSRSLMTSAIPTKVVSSKLWHDETVVDWDRVLEVRPVCFDEIRHEPHLFQQYLLHLFFRYIVGIPDPADRNFLLTHSPGSVRQDVIYSVDDEGLDRNTDYANALRKTKCTFIREFATQHFQTAILSWLRAWWERFPDRRQRIESIMSVEGVSRVFSA